MAKASITLWDDEDGSVRVEANFGEQIEPESKAHQMVDQLLSAVLGAAKNFQQIEDTAGDMPTGSVEPEEKPRIFVPGNDTQN